MNWILEVWKRTKYTFWHWTIVVPRERAMQRFWTEDAKYYARCHREIARGVRGDPLKMSREQRMKETLKHIHAAVNPRTSIIKAWIAELLHL